MEWSDKLLTGVESIDSEHIELIRRANAFCDALKCVNPRSALIEALDSLITISETHRRTEEELLLRIGYPHFKKHQRLHESLYENLDKMYGFFKDQCVNPYTGAFLAEAASAWLVDHIRLHDRDIGNYIRRLSRPQLDDFALPATAINLKG